MIATRASRPTGADPVGPHRIPLLRAAASFPVLLVLLVAGGCRGALEVTPSDHERVLAHRTLDAPDPSAPGPYGVRTLYYGSGRDRNRPEYRDSVTLVTEPVDGSKLVDFGDDADERREYWGFGTDSLPLNARVWYPDTAPADGPFPLVLVVHGNHDPKDFSDPGYGYLGELLASRGFVVASVDMNFVNGAIRGENDVRGWLLLKHLQAWRGFVADADGPFGGSVDMERIALMGHSRGGEAVGVAAAFNGLERYPDDATLTFDFGFDIRGIVALAPVDGQYLPTGRKTPVRDVSYLVLHGSHDGDVTSFHGLRWYDRVELTPGSGHFKAAVYVYRANHGQWNTLWGAHDLGPRSGRILDLRALMPAEHQRRLAEVYLTAFLESRLRDDERWLPLFRDHRVAGDLLPPTMYVTRFADDSFTPLATFEEDIDVTTGTAAGVTVEAHGLETWREDELRLRSSNWPETSRSQENQAVWLGWDDAADDDREGPKGDAAFGSGSAGPASWTLHLPDGLARGVGLDGEASLQLSLAPTEAGGADGADAGDGADEGDAAGGAGEAGMASVADGVDGDTGGRGADAGAADGSPGAVPGPVVDVTVEVEDAAGRTARVPLSAYGPLRLPLEIRVLRRADQEREAFENFWDLVLQTYVLPLSDFVEAEPELRLDALTTVRLLFDRTPAGEVVVDEVGFSQLEPAFRSARIPR